MKKLLTILFFLVQIFAFAQTDTVYLNRFWKECKIDSAKYYRVVENKTIHNVVTNYYKNSNKIQMTGKYLTSKLETKIGTFTYYDTIGNVDRIEVFDKGKKSGEWLYYYDYSTNIHTKKIFENDNLIRFNIYYKNGKLKREEIFQDTSRIKAECYDSLGYVVPFYEYEVPAEYKGGMAAARIFLEENIKFPTEAVNLGIDGKCYLKFIVTENGNTSNVTVIRGVPDCPECDAEAVRVVKLMKDWNPGMIDGKKINSTFTLPVHFKSGKVKKKKRRKS